MANLILASKRTFKSGDFWHVYRSENGNKSDEFFFSANNPVKALRYAFILRSRHGAIIPKGVYGKLMADVKASKTENTESAQAERTAQGTTENTAPVESKAESAPKKKAPRKRTAKKANTEPSTESK